MLVGPEARPWRRALSWLAILGPFFFASYGFANWLASRRAEVGAVVFGWESSIPFMPWTIVPYWTIDALYGLSLFLCVSRRELDVHGRRLLLAQLICVLCFVTFPLRYSFARPDAGGWVGWLFSALMEFDKPFNQAPSLHIALLIVLWVLYQRRVAWWMRWAVHGWFTLIGLSVLTTYQHHFIDIPTGMLAGWLCVWAIPDAEESPFAGLCLMQQAARRRLAARYGAAGIAIAVAGIGFGGWALWLVWPAVSLLIVGAIYGLMNEAAFQKHPDGSMSIAARWLLAPYLVGAWLNSRWWTRSMAGAAVVAPGVMIGRLPTRAECRSQGICAVVDMAAELPFKGKDVKYFSVPQLDLTVPSPGQLERAAGAIEAAIVYGPVLVCCALGFSRSAAAVAAWLVQTGRAGGITDAVERLRRAQPRIVLGSEHLRVLEAFALRGPVA